MSDRWLTVTDAAKRVGVDPRTVRRYITRDGLVEIAGRVSEAAVVKAEQAARQRAKAGRPPRTSR
jgi:DNA-binding LacI/PurR family transcriptional regulator